MATSRNVKRLTRATMAKFNLTYVAALSKLKQEGVVLQVDTPNGKEWRVRPDPSASTERGKADDE